MKILDSEKLEAGEPFTLELNDSERDALVIEGFRALIAEKGLDVKVETHNLENKCENIHEITKDQEDFLINLAINEIIKEYLKKHE